MVTRYPVFQRWAGRVGVAAAMCALAGCTSEATRAQSRAIVRPAMPRMMGDVLATRPELREDDIVAAALAHARRGDFAAARQALQSLVDATARGRVTGRLVGALAQQDPELAARFATGLPSTSAQSAALGVAARALVQRDRDAALRWAAELPDDVPSAAARRAVIEELARENPRWAAEQLSTLPASPPRDATLAIAAATWARADAAGATAWLGRLPEGELKRRVTSGVGFEIAQRNPNRALAVAEMPPPGRDRWLLLAAIAQTWVAVDESAALTWVNQLPAGEARDAAFVGVDASYGVSLGRRRGGVSVGGGGPSRRRGGNVMASLWPEIDSPAFVAWLQTQPDGLSRDEAIVEYARQRGLSESAAVAEWLARLPRGAARDRAMEIYLEQMLAASPSDAARWLRSMPRSDRSDEMIEKTVERLMFINPEAAEALLRDANLPPDRYERLLRLRR